MQASHLSWPSRTVEWSAQRWSPDSVGRRCCALRARGCHFFLDFPWRLGPTALPSRRVPRPYLLLDALGVDPEAEGRGIGGALLESVISRCDADEGCRGVYVETASARARHVYERAGFELVEERSGAGLTVSHLFSPTKNRRLKDD